MKVSELIHLLEDVDQDATVLLAHQPSWPLQFTVAGVYDPATDGAPDDDDDEDHPTDRVYIVEGSHPRNDSPYAPRAAWAEMVTF